MGKHTSDPLYSMGYQIEMMPLLPQVIRIIARRGLLNFNEYGISEVLNGVSIFAFSGSSPDTPRLLQEHSCNGQI